MITVLYIVQIILGITLIALAMMQAKNLGSGAVFGGSDSFQTTKRGFERTLFNLTLVVSILFFIVALFSAALT